MDCGRCEAAEAGARRFLKKILRVVDFDEELRSPHLGRSSEENPQRLLRCTNYKHVESLSCRSAQLCCRDEVMKPLYKQEMYTLKVNSTRNFNSQIPFPLQFCVVPSCACGPCFCLKQLQKAIQYLFSQPFSHYRNPAAYPPHHISTASYFT